VKYKLIFLIVAITVYISVIIIWKTEISNPLFVENTYDYRDVKVSILKISATWMNQTISRVPFSLIDKNFNLLYENFTNVSPVFINMTKVCRDNGSYYLNMTYTAHFIEGGEEIRYIYFLINYDKISKDTLNIILHLNPNIWEKDPTILVESK